MNRPLILTALFFGCAVASPADDSWKPLCNGANLDGWTAPGGGTPGTGWEVKDGAIHRAAKAGDIVTAADFLNFELEFEWKVAEKANSGLKYRVADYAPAGRNIGIEFQILDDAGHSNGKVEKTSAGSAYDLLPPAKDKKLKPVGEWNQARIVARGNEIEHWLNGEKVLSFTIGGEAWKKALAGSKFKAAADFGTKKGRILLQDHGDEAWFRNLRIRELPEKP